MRNVLELTSGISVVLALLLVGSSASVADSVIINNHSFEDDMHAISGGPVFGPTPCLALQWAFAGEAPKLSAKPNTAANIVAVRVNFAAFIAFPLFVPDPESW